MGIGPLVAVASRSFSRHPVLRAELLAKYPNVRFNETRHTLTGEALIRFLSGAEKAIIGLERIDDATLAAQPSLTLISKYGVGFDLIDLESMQRRGVRLGWTPGVNRRSVAELVLAFTLALLHRIPEATRALQGGKWEQPAGRQLTGKTVGVLGCGNVGRDVSVLMRAFECRVLAHDILDFPDFYAGHGVEPVQLDVLLAESDIVTLHVPLDSSTAGMLTAARLGSMRPGAFLINTARGGLIDEAALAVLLDTGRLGGVAVDVYAVEPPEINGILGRPNVIATPHIGGSTGEAILAMGRAALGGLDAGKIPDQNWPVSRQRPVAD